jgi:effector-binding domain-containing protein
MWVLFIIALFIAIAYFLPQKIYVERESAIEASPMTVYSQIIDLHSWNKWSRWNQIDPNMEINYINKGVGVGAGYSWESENKNVGKGTIEIVEAVKFDSVVVKMNFMEQGAARSSFLFEESGNSTMLKWTLSYDVGYNPFARWMGLMMDNYIGKDFEAGLINLNALSRMLEKEKEYLVLIDELERFHFVSIREKVPFIEVSLKMGEMYGEIGTYINNMGAEKNGKPYAMYHLMNEQDIDLECGIPTKVLVKGDGDFLAGTFPETKCATVDFYGDYRGLEEGHMAVQQWIEKRGFALVGAPMEIYLTDPGSDPNPENWLTRIYYPVD